MELSHWHVDLEQKALAVLKNLALNANVQNCNFLCMDLRESKASKHIGFVQNHITKAYSFACHPRCLLLLL